MPFQLPFDKLGIDFEKFFIETMRENVNRYVPTGRRSAGPYYASSSVKEPECPACELHRKLLQDSGNELILGLDG